MAENDLKTVIAEGFKGLQFLRQAIAQMEESKIATFDSVGSDILEAALIMVESDILAQIPIDGDA